MIVRILLLSHVFLTVPLLAFDLTLLHTNDFHDRVEETNKYSGSCSDEDAEEGDCYAGLSRIVAKVKEVREQIPNTLFVDAGDQFQGTLWFFKFGGSVTATLMNFAGYDAMGLGNHEFDTGVKGLVPFVDNVSFPVLSSNIDLSHTPELQGKVGKSTKVTVGGETIGIIGYTTTETPYISNPGTVKFYDELEAIQAEADKLMAEGVNKIIGVGHAGYVEDLELARRLRGVDVLVGGHSNTFLYNGEEPSNEKATGAYPTVEQSEATGENVLIVHGYAYGKYLGFLQITFDEQGRAIGYGGNPILLDSSVPQDPETEALLAQYQHEVEALATEVIGSTHVFLEGSASVCRVKECNMGNLITDAMVKQNIRASDSTYWSDVAIAVLNSGGIRSSIDKGEITVGDAVSVQPFRNTVDIVEVKGSTILKMFEQSASGWNEGIDPYGGFLQVAGLRVVYDMSQPVGERVVDIKVRCAKCLIPKFEPLNMDEVYQVLMNNFMADGGDSYSVIPRETLNRHTISNVDVDIMVQYITDTTPMTDGLEGRILFVEDVLEDPLTMKALEQTLCAYGASSSLMSHSGIVLFCLLILSLLVREGN